MARTEARHAFGDPTVFLERQITDARHVEVQVIADHHGSVWAVGLRDCTLQRRHQKVIEESACTLLDAEQEREIRRRGGRAVPPGRVHQRRHGRVPVLAGRRAAIYFMEVNARLQVEHPVTELTTGLDLVKLQIEVARGGRLAGEPPAATSGHAIEARLNAEDPDNQFAPAPGRIRWFRPPTGPGVRVDTGVAEGDEIAAEYDSMIAKVLGVGPRPGGGPGAPGPGAGADPGHRRRRPDQQGLPPRAARASRCHRRPTTTPAWLDAPHGDR